MVDTSARTPTALSDEAAVRSLLARLAEMWAAGDATGYADVFTPDADYTAFDGTVMRGQEQIAAGHAALFAGIMKGSRLLEQSSVVRFPHPDCAIVTSQGGIVMSWQRRRSAPSRKRLSALTLVAVRRDGQWTLTAFQNTRYRPWNRTALGRLMILLARRQMNRDTSGSGGGQT